MLIQRKNKWCKCPCAWLNTNHFFLLHICIARDISHQFPPKCLFHSRSWMGPFSPWKHLNGVGRIGPFSLHSSKVCQKFMVFCGAWRYTEEAMCPLQENKVIVTHWQHHSSSRKKTTSLEKRHLVMSSFDFQSPLHITSKVSQGLWCSSFVFFLRF